MLSILKDWKLLRKVSGPVEEGKQKIKPPIIDCIHSSKKNADGVIKTNYFLWIPSKSGFQDEERIETENGRLFGMNHSN